MKVIYRREKYDVCLKDACSIWVLQIKLLYLRILRNLHRISIACKSVIILIPLWVIFVFVSYMWGVNIGKVTSIGGMLWDFKISIFSSLIIVGFLNIHNSQKKYKEVLEQQSYLYYELLCGFESYAKIMCLDYTPERYSDHLIFYTHDKYARFYKCIERYGPCLEIVKYLNEERQECLLLLEKLKESVKGNEIISWNNERKRKEHNGQILNDIESMSKGIMKYQQVEQPTEQKELFLGIVRDMYYLIESCRIPWRRDFQIDQKIRMLLRKKNEEKLKDEYYMRLFLE